jgi:N-acetylneuraminate synthase
MQRPYVIAEIGANHCGDFELARRMVRIAADFCGVDFVKFQKRDIGNIPNGEVVCPDPAQAYGRTIREHRQALEFTFEQHEELKKLAHSLKIGYGCSVFDQPSLEGMIALAPDYIKFGSAVNERVDLLEYAFDNWPRDIHISLGMMTLDVRRLLMSFLWEHGKGRDAKVVLYHCVTAYPVRPKHAALQEIAVLSSAKQPGIFDEVGYSGHHQGVALDLVAFTLGAQWIERHFTLDRTWKGTDHIASLEPDGLRKVVKYLNDAAEAITLKPEGGIVECEIESRRKYKGG